MQKNPNIACYVLSPQGLKLAKQLKSPVHIFVHEGLGEHDEQEFSSLPLLIASTFHEYEAHIFICATGIAVRSIAPHIVHKGLDPAVVACDEQGNFVISLLSGHWGGGNALAAKLASELGPQSKAVITTATDVNNLPAVDMLAKEQGCIILDWDKIKYINSAILKKEAVQLYDPLGIFSMHKELFDDISIYNDLTKLKPNAPAVCIDWRKIPEHPQLLRLAMPCLCVGIGCKKGTSKEDIQKALEQCLKDANLEPKAVSCLASVDIKAQEEGLIKTAEQLNLPLQFFSAHELADAPNISPSAMAAQLFGVDDISVSEGSALLAAGGDNASLLVPKVKIDGHITIAIAISEHFIPKNAEIL